jgi:hypothetical protein
VKQFIIAGRALMMPKLCFKIFWRTKVIFYYAANDAKQLFSLSPMHLLIPKPILIHARYILCFVQFKGSYDDRN